MKLTVFLFSSLLSFCSLAMYGGENIPHAQKVDGKLLYKHIVKLFIKKISGPLAGKNIVCTGTILTKRTIITAAHCILDAKEVTVRFFHPTNGEENGDLDTVDKGNQFLTENPVLNSDKESITVIQSDSKIQLIKSPQVFNSDIGIIKLNSDLPRSYLPVPLLPANLNLDPNQLIKVGFGRGSNMNGSVGKFSLEFENKGALFAWPKKAAEGSSCYGDSGGGIFQYFNGKLYLVGILNAILSIKSGDKETVVCNPLVQAEIASDVRYYSHWIKSIVPEISLDN